MELGVPITFGFVVLENLLFDLFIASFYNNHPILLNVSTGFLQYQPLMILIFKGY